MGSPGTIAVFGIYEAAESTQAAFVDLVNSGFTSSDISILLPDNERTRAFAVEKNTRASESAADSASPAETAGSGVAPLAILGELAIPGVGRMIAGGPILATLMGVSVGGTLGGLVGAFIGLGLPEFEAKLCEGAVRGGGALLSINCNAVEQVPNAKTCLERTGARDVACASEAILEDASGNESNASEFSDGHQLGGPGSLAESPG
jgi:hypothetical protein